MLHLRDKPPKPKRRMSFKMRIRRVSTTFFKVDVDAYGPLARYAKTSLWLFKRDNCFRKMMIKTVQSKYLLLLCVLCVFVCVFVCVFSSRSVCVCDDVVFLCVCDCCEPAVYTCICICYVPLFMVMVMLFLFNLFASGFITSFCS